MRLKYFEKFNKRKQQKTTDNLNLLSTEYVALDENNNLVATYKTMDELKKTLSINEKLHGYVFKTYTLTTAQNL